MENPSIPGSENWIRDDDPVFALLDEWHDKDEYEKILSRIEEIPEEKRSNEVYFRKISALNNLSRYAEARKEIQFLSPRCNSGKDLGKLFYMLGYIYDQTNCEYRAVECYRMSYQLDPEKEGTTALIEESIEYARKDMQASAKALSDFFSDIHTTFESSSDTKADPSGKAPSPEEIPELEVATYLGLVGSSFMSSWFGIKLNLGEIYGTCAPDKKEAIRKLLKDRSNITDLPTLQKYFGEHRLAPLIVDVQNHMSGKKEFPVDRLDVRQRTRWEVSEQYLKDMGEFIPASGLSAWDYNDIIGLARLMYAADMLTKEELAQTYLFAVDECRRLFSSWEEFTKSLVMGAFYNTLTRETDYNVREALKFALTAGGLCKHVYRGVKWLK